MLIRFADANSVLGADLVWFDCLMQVNISGSTYLLIIPKVLKLLTWKYCCSLYYAYPTPVFFWLISLRRPVVLCWLMLAYRRWQPREWSEGLRKNWAQEIARQTLQLAEALLLCGVNAKTLSQLTNYKILMALASISHYPLCFQLDIHYFSFDKNMMRHI